MRAIRLSPPLSAVVTDEIANPKARGRSVIVLAIYPKTDTALVIHADGEMWNGIGLHYLRFTEPASAFWRTSHGVER